MHGPGEAISECLLVRWLHEEICVCKELCKTELISLVHTG
jgi:hypothetical protein